MWEAKLRWNDINSADVQIETLQIPKHKECPINACTNRMEVGTQDFEPYAHADTGNVKGVSLHYTV